MMAALGTQKLKTNSALQKERIDMPLMTQRFGPTCQEGLQQSGIGFAGIMRGTFTHSLGLPGAVDGAVEGALPIGVSLSACPKPGLFCALFPIFTACRARPRAPVVGGARWLSFGGRRLAKSRSVMLVMLPRAG
jgi:hypothetical protein